MSKKSECFVVRDLLNLYIEDLVSEKSKNMVECHLTECKNCSKYFEELKEQISEQQAEEKRRENLIIKKLKRKKYELLGVLLGIFFTFAAIFFGPFILFRFITPFVDEDVRDVNLYGMQKYHVVSDLRIFPDKDNMTGQIREYRYGCIGMVLAPRSEIYLECSYSDSEYELEKNRLLHISDKKPVIYTDDEMVLPCVYAMMYDKAYEYALFDDEMHTIYYIYLQDWNREDLGFRKKFLPEYYGMDGNIYSLDEGIEGYSIYKK